VDKRPLPARHSFEACSLFTSQMHFISATLFQQFLERQFLERSSLDQAASAVLKCPCRKIPFGIDSASAAYSSYDVLHLLIHNKGHRDVSVAVIVAVLRHCLGIADGTPDAVLKTHNRWPNASHGSMKNCNFTSMSAPRPVNVNAPMPTGWAAYSNAKGQVFYFNHATGQTQWHFPKPVKKMLPVGKLGMAIPGIMQGNPLEALIGVGIGDWFDKRREKSYRNSGYDVQKMI